MKMMRNDQGATLVELVVVMGILALVLIGVIQVGIGIKRSFTQWTTGVYSNPPAQIQWAPATGTFIFSVTRGTGVDANGQPAGPGVALANDTWNFQIIGSGGDPCTIKSLNGTTIDAQSGTATSDVAGLIIIVVEVDDDGPYVLKATRPGSTTIEERTLFIGVP